MPLRVLRLGTVSENQDHCEIIRGWPQAPTYQQHISAAHLASFLKAPVSLLFPRLQICCSGCEKGRGSGSIWSSVRTIGDTFYQHCFWRVSFLIVGCRARTSTLYSVQRSPSSPTYHHAPLFDPNLLLLNVTLGYRWNALGRTSYALYGQSPSQPQTPPQQILPDAPILVAKETALIIYSILLHGFIEQYPPPSITEGPPRWNKVATRPSPVDDRGTLGSRHLQPKFFIPLTPRRAPLDVRRSSPCRWAVSSNICAGGGAIMQCTWEGTGERNVVLSNYLSRCAPQVLTSKRYIFFSKQSFSIV